MRDDSLWNEGNASDWLSRVGAVRLVRSGRHSKQRPGRRIKVSLAGRWRNFDFFRKYKSEYRYSGSLHRCSVVSPLNRAQGGARGGLDNVEPAAVLGTASGG